MSKKNVSTLSFKCSINFDLHVIESSFQSNFIKKMYKEYDPRYVGNIIDYVFKYVLKRTIMNGKVKPINNFIFCEEFMKELIDISDYILDPQDEIFYEEKLEYKGVVGITDFRIGPNLFEIKVSAHKAITSQHITQLLIYSYLLWKRKGIKIMTINTINFYSGVLSTICVRDFDYNIIESYLGFSNNI